MRLINAEPFDLCRIVADREDRGIAVKDLETIDAVAITPGALADDFRSVYREISRQIELFGDQSDRHPLEYLAFITEEIGELAEAITETFMNGRHPERGGYDNMVKEAIHVAATAISAISCIRRMEMKQNELEI